MERLSSSFFKTGRNAGVTLVRDFRRGFLRDFRRFLARVSKENSWSSDFKQVTWLLSVLAALSASPLVQLYETV